MILHDVLQTANKRDQNGNQRRESAQTDLEQDELALKIELGLHYNQPSILA